MRDLTICMAYYLNAGMLALQYEHLAAMPHDLRTHLRLIVVDDGSPHDPAVSPAKDPGFPVEVYRMLQDVRWNQDACRNLAVERSATDWLLLTDMDHMVPEVTLRKAIEKALDPRTVYRFSRVSAPDMAPYKPHPNSWLLTRPVFDAMGGYDEAMAGHYGTDADFRDRVQAIAPVVTLKEHLIRVPREVIPDASTTTYERKTPEDGPAIRAIKAQRSEGWRPLRGSFAWEQVA